MTQRLKDLRLLAKLDTELDRFREYHGAVYAPSHNNNFVYNR